MPNRRMPLIIPALRLQTLCIVLTCACLLGCESMHQRRQLIALTVQPANADAIAPSGTAPFSADGTFDQSPIVETNVPVQWTSSDTSVATIDSRRGVATCQVAGGPVTITASASGKGGTVQGSGGLNCFASKPVAIGHCSVPDGSTMNGDCLGTRGGICRSAYDPTNCPVGQTPISPGSIQCGSTGLVSVDTASSCVP
jgi:hypothetical protein